MTDEQLAEVERAVRTATVIKTGDRVLLTTVEVLDQEVAASVLDQLHVRFADAEFTLVAGITDIAVQR